MDDSWGNILYLVVMALFVIIGALKKKKPPVVIQSPDDGEIYQQPTSQPSSGFESLLETLLGNEIPKPYVQPIEDAIPEPEETMMEEYARLQNLKAEARGEKKETVFSDLKLLYTDIDDQKDEGENQSEEIDWCQAIIYKEILDRRYT